VFVLLPILLVLGCGLPLVPVLEVGLCGLAAGLILARCLVPERSDRP
jgi:hypothetical protein